MVGGDNMLKINGYDNLKKYLLENCKDKDYIKENLKDIIDDNMLEAENNVTGIVVKIKTTQEKILLDYNISYGKTSIDLVEYFEIINIINLNEVK
jgi:hypothetical protein